MFCSDLEFMLASMSADLTFDAAQSGIAMEERCAGQDLKASLENDVAAAIRLLVRSVET